MPSELEIVATHEAGHVTAYIHFAVPFGGVRLYQPEVGELLGAVRSPAGIYSCWRRAVCCLAGPVAEHKLTGVVDRDAWRHDHEMATEALSRLGRPSGDLEDVTAFARRIIERRWSTCRLIARRLAETGELSYDDVMLLVW